jgi:imidazolonepropionase-like amidohydrolase
MRRSFMTRSLASLNTTLAIGLITGLGLTLCTASSSVEAQPLLLQGAQLHPVSAPPMGAADVLVGEDGRIAAIGADLSSRAAELDATIVDLTGLHLYPGLIAATSSLGLTEISSVRATNDSREMGDFNARLHAYRSVNPDSELLPVTRANGITHCLVVPGGSFVRGQSGLLRLSGWTWEERLVEGPVGLHVSWPSQSLRRGDDASPMKKQEAERKARVRELDDWVARARVYDAARRDGEEFTRDLELEAWSKVLSGEIRLFVHANEERQIRSALQWTSGHELGFVLVGGRDAYRLAEELAAAEVSVVLEAVMRRPAYDFEGVDAGYKRASRLNDAGVQVAISIGSGSFADTVARNLAYHAGMARAHGLPNDVALRTITLAPARILGVDRDLGSIEVGKSASLIATTGDILEIRTRIERMWIDGVATSLDNRHQRLFERYRTRPRASADQASP